MTLSKTLSHGRIGEAAVTAKCWMNGIKAYNTAGLRSNFKGSDLIVETLDSRNMLWIQVKTGYQPTKGKVYLTQCAGDKDLEIEKFVSDFVIFVNIDPSYAKSHNHDGKLDFEHLSYYIVPKNEANRLYQEAVKVEYDKPKLDGGQRKLANMSVIVPADKMELYHNKWELIRQAAG